MRVLVTGGAGFIGSHLVDALVDGGHKVVVLDNLDPQVHGPRAEPVLIASHIAAGRVRFLRADVCDCAAVDAALEGVDCVVHLAAAVGVGQSMYKPHYYVHTNCEGTGVLLEALVRRRGRLSGLVVASSMSLYGEGAYACPRCGGSECRERSEEQLAAGRWEVLCAACGAGLEPRPTTETKRPSVSSVYAATKKHQEELCLAFGPAHQLTTFALRFFNVIGPRQSLNNPYTGIAAIFLSRLMNGRPPLVFEDGLQSRDFIDVRDVASCVRRAVEFTGPGSHILNVGTGRPTTVLQMARTLASLLGKDVEPRVLGHFRVGDVRHCFADPASARSTLGFEARYSLEEALLPLIEWSRGKQAQDAVELGLQELRENGLLR
jgi:dTDP-L-rhamnose 4-epimerase